MQDLSHTLPVAALVGDSSMAATNTVSDESQSMTAPGSESESSASVDRGTPMPEIPAQAPRSRVVTVQGDEGNPFIPWNRADGSPWREADRDAGPETARPGAQPRGSDGRWQQL